MACTEGVYIIQHHKTQRYLFQTGEPVQLGDDAVSKDAPPVVGTDSNYNNRAYWKISQDGDKYVIENIVTRRYLFQTGEPMKGNRTAENGWKAAPHVVGADGHADDRAHWKIFPQGDNYLFESVGTNGRYLFQSGEKIEGEPAGNEGLDFDAPPTVGADANYYNRALWKLIKP